MYISGNGTNILNIADLNHKSPNCTWEKEIQTEEAIKLNCSPKNDNFTIGSKLHELSEVIKSQFGFSLTGIKYNIEEHTIQFVFSDWTHITENETISEELSNQERNGIVIPRTVSQNNVVTITGGLRSLKEWGFKLSSISVVKNDGLQLEAYRI